MKKGGRGAFGVAAANGKLLGAPVEFPMTWAEFWEEVQVQVQVQVQAEAVSQLRWENKKLKGVCTVSKS